MSAMVEHRGGGLALAVTWQPDGQGGQTGRVVVVYSVGEGDRGDMTLAEAERLAEGLFGSGKLVLPLPQGGIEWVPRLRRPGHIPA